MANIKNVFENANLNGSFQLLWAHNLNDVDIAPVWFDENGVEIGTEQAFEVVDANNIILNCNEAITGFHTLILFYDADAPLIAGRRLFELTESASPDDTYRIAVGKAGFPSVNTTLADLKTLLALASGALLASKNLEDLENIVAAQGFLDVYSRGYLNTILASKASLYQAGSGSAIGISNTAAFNTVSDYNIASKIYVDTAIERVDLVLTEYIGTYTQTRCEVIAGVVKVYIEWSYGIPPSGYFLIAKIPAGYRPRYDISADYISSGVTKVIPYKINTAGEITINVFGGAGVMVINQTYML